MKLKSLLVISLLSVTSLTAIGSAVAETSVIPAPPPLPSGLSTAQIDAKKSVVKPGATGANTTQNKASPSTVPNAPPLPPLLTQAQIDAKKKAADNAAAKMRAGAAHTADRVQHNAQQRNNWAQNRLRGKNGIIQGQQETIAEQNKLIAHQALELDEIANNVKKVIAFFENKIKEAKDQSGGNPDAEKVALKQAVEQKKQESTTAVKQAANEVNKAITDAKTSGDTSKVEEAKKNLEKAVGQDAAVKKVAETVAKTAGTPNANPAIDLKKEEVKVDATKAATDAATKASENVDKKAAAQGVPVASTLPGAKEAIPGLNVTPQQLQDAKAGLKPINKDGKSEVQGAPVPPPPPPAVDGKAPGAGGQVTAADLKMQQKFMGMSSEEKAKLAANLEKALAKVNTDLAAPNLDPAKKDKLERGKNTLEGKIKSLKALIAGNAAGVALGDKKAEGAKEPVVGGEAPKVDAGAHSNDYPAEDKAEGAKEPVVGGEAPKADAGAHSNDHSAEDKAEGAKEPVVGGEAPKVEALNAVNKVADKVEDKAKEVENKAHEVEAKEAEANQKAAAGDQKGAEEAKSEAEHKKEELKKDVVELQNLKDQHEGAVAAVTEAAKAEGLPVHSEDHPVVNAGEPHAAPGSEPKAEGLPVHSEDHPKVSAEEKAKVDEKKSEADHKEQEAKAKEAEVQNAVASGAGNDEVAKLQAELKAMRDAQEAAKIAAEKAQNEAEKKALNDKIKDLEEQVSDLVKAAKAAGAKIVYELGEDGKKHMNFVIEEKKPTEPAKPAEPVKTAETQAEETIQNLTADDISTQSGAKNLREELNNVKDAKTKKKLQDELVEKAVDLVLNNETKRVLNSVPGVSKIEEGIHEGGKPTRPILNPVTGDPVGIEVGVAEKKEAAPAPAPAPAARGG